MYINITKYHCDFILEFFFDSTTEMTDEEYKEILMQGGGKHPVNTVIKKSDQGKSSVQNRTGNEPVYPIYFKHVKINETKLNINFLFSENSTMVIL